MEVRLHMREEKENEEDEEGKEEEEEEEHWDGEFGNQSPARKTNPRTKYRE